MTARPVIVTRWLLPALALLGLACVPRRGDLGPLGVNAPPTVRLTHAPFDDGSAYFYAYRMNWIGYDPDGRVVGFVYAVDPPLNGGPIDWVETTKNEQIIFFTASDPDSSSPLQRSLDFHTFAIRAIDDRGDSSEIVTRSFFSYTAAPTVTITNPRPNALIRSNLTPAVRVTWTGTDPDGQFNTRPIKYKYTLIGAGSEFPLETAILDPDSVRRYYAPEFAGWDSTPGDTTVAAYTNLTPGATYLFVVVAFDEAGAYSPIFTLNNNMLRFRVGFAGNLGPRITMFNETLFYQYPSGGYSTDPRREVFFEVPEGTVVNFNWYATPPEGADITSYRWALDIPDVSDDSPRSDETTDVSRWSQASLLSQSAIVGPFAGGTEHRFYIEASDNIGLKSLGIARFQVVRSTLDNPLLIVDDTRFLGDELASGGPCVRLPAGEWPTAAELDTFLFARGGVPWRCYPEGTMSTPGLFAGYPFDTLGTRTGDNDATVRLATLGQYAHVVWVIDAGSAVNFKPGSNPFDPITSLRYMSTPGNFNSLGAYQRQGGKLWLVGGGALYATAFPWNDNENDAGGVTFSSALGELVPGRFAYDVAGWQSEAKVVKAPMFIQRNLGRTPSYPGAPPYTTLPTIMGQKSSFSDPFPPGREGQSPGAYYPSVFNAEFLSAPNRVIQDVDPDPDVLNEQSTLDTLYQVVTFALPPTSFQRVAMTYYHPPGAMPVVFTGFSLWDYRRSDCEALVDFVLRDIWGLARNPLQAGGLRAGNAPAAAVRRKERLAPEP